MRKRTLTTTAEEEVYLNPGDSIRSLFDVQENRVFENLRRDPRFEKLRTKLREIQNVGREKGACEGEVLQLINKGYFKPGYVWDTIPYGEMDDIKEFVRNNVESRLKILHPEMFELLRSNVAVGKDYRELISKIGTMKLTGGRP